jgi:hypothetical protein
MNGTMQPIERLATAPAPTPAPGRPADPEPEEEDAEEEPASGWLIERDATGAISAVVERT